MKIAVSPYSLHPLGYPKRKGALLKVVYADGLAGYADCHPCVELGAAPLEEQIAILKRRCVTSVTKQSLAFARLDAEARAEKRNLFRERQVPGSHHLVLDAGRIKEELRNDLQGIRAIKVKVASQEEAKAIVRWADLLRQRELKLRLDFNSQLNQKQFLSFLQQCAGCLDVIEFFEDPFPYHPLQWQEVRQTCRVSLACDLESRKGLMHPQSCDFLVVKPAVQEISPFLTPRRGSRRLVITSCIDHSVGQLAAAYVAAMADAEILADCGLLSHQALTPTPFSGKLQRQGARLMPSLEGYGWGYDEMLAQLAWQPL